MANFISEKCHGCELCVRYCPVDAIHGEIKARHIIDAALCIECDVCGRVCGFGAVEDPRGEVIQRLTRELWPTPQFNYSLCENCNVCLQACPTGAIALRTSIHGKKGAAHPKPVLLKSKLCLGCALCASACPSGAIRMFVPEFVPVG